MLIYVGKRFSASVNGAVIKSVSCERCRLEYFYQLARNGTGHGTAPYYIGQAAAKRRAENRAKKRLEKRLRTESESVPCPGCGWIQHEMVQKFRKGRYAWLRQTTLILGSIAAFFELFIVLVLYSEGTTSRETWIQLYEWLLVTIGATGAFLSVRTLLVQRINPNHAYPQRPSVPAGTPPALLREANDGVERYAPAQVEQAVQVSDWAEFQVQRCVLPTICCVCANEPGRHVFKLPLIATAELPAPLCPACHRSITHRWWLWALLSLLAGVLFAAVVAMAVPRKEFDQIGRWILFIVVSLAASIIAVASIPRWRVKPYRMKVIDSARGVVRVWFANPEYTRQLIEMYQASSVVEFRATATTLDYFGDRENA